MCNEIMRTMPNAFYCIPDDFKRQKMCIKAIEVDPSFFQLVPDHLKTQETYDRAVKDDSSPLQFVLDWFITKERVDMWYDDYYDEGDYWVTDDEDKFFEWYDGYTKRNTQKAQIKKELIPIAWHSSRWWDRCRKKRKKRQKNCGDKYGLFCVW